jgi:hypothetical protein
MRTGLNRSLSCILQRNLILCGVAVSIFGQTSTHATTSTHWVTGLVPEGGSLGVEIGALTPYHDGWDGGPTIYFWDPGTYLLLHRDHGPDWAGDTGFYGADYESPIPSGGSKTWRDFYLWSDLPGVLNQIQVRSVFELGVGDGPPAGYRGHLVIDQVADGVTWTGPMDYWFDMTQYNTFLLPIASVSDPLQGTRFHLTVYAPVPEPSSILALGLALTGMGAMLRRRR